MGDHVLTPIAYSGIGGAVGWWFWRAHAGFLNPAAHAVVSILFGLLWPISLPWRAFVRVLSRAAAARRRARALVESQAETAPVRPD